MRSAAPSSVPPVPPHLHLKVSTTEECNFRCSYCYLHKVPDTLSVEQVQRIAELTGKHPAQRLSVEISGGEPTLAWDRLVQLYNNITAAVHGPTRWLLTTNGAEVTPERWDWLRERQFDVRTSLDGDEETYIRHRFHKAVNRRDAEAQAAVYRQVLQRIREGARRGVEIGANLVVAPDTVDRLVDNAIFVRDSGLRHCKISPVTGRLWTESALARLRAELAEWRRIVARNRILFSGPAHAADLAADLAHAMYACGADRRDPDTLRIVVDAKGRLYADEFEEATRKALRIGDIAECASFAELPRLPDDNMTLTYSMRIYPAAVLDSVLRAQAAVIEHLLLLQNMVLGQPAAAVPPRAEASPTDTDWATENVARQLLAPLSPGGALVEGYRWTTVEPGEGLLLRFRPDGGVSTIRPEVALRITRREGEEPAFAFSRHYKLQVLGDGRVDRFDGAAKRLTTAIGNLMRRNDP